MLQGVGSRFDFHVCKTLSDLRYGKATNLKHHGTDVHVQDTGDL